VPTKPSRSKASDLDPDTEASCIAATPSRPKNRAKTPILPIKEFFYNYSETAACSAREQEVQRDLRCKRRYPLRITRPKWNSPR
jgi:hypothetical protein